MYSALHSRDIFSLYNIVCISVIDSLLQIDNVFPDIAQVGYAFGYAFGQFGKIFFTICVFFFKISGNFSDILFFQRAVLVIIITPAGIYCIKMTGNTQSICIYQYYYLNIRSTNLLNKYQGAFINSPGGANKW